jgi:DNA repair ATPase RecN
MVLDEQGQKVLSDLKRKRGVVKDSLTRMSNYVTKFNTETDDVALLEFRQEELPQLNRKFDDIQSQIELLEDDFDIEADERDKFEVDYFLIRPKM